MAQTAQFTAPQRSLAQTLAAPFLALGKGMMAMAESGGRMQQIKKLNLTTDADLLASGKTREGEIRRGARDSPGVRS